MEASASTQKTLSRKNSVAMDFDTRVTKRAKRSILRFPGVTVGNRWKSEKRYTPIEFKEMCLRSGNTRNDFTIDEGDYLVVKEILSKCYRFNEAQLIEWTQEEVTIHKSDENRRIYKFDLRGQKILSCIPDPMRQLQSLSELKIDQMYGPLPEGIGDLLNLIKLTINYGNFGYAPIPSTIGKLKNLEILHITLNNTFSKVPEEIGQLQNLRELVLKGAVSISKLPEEIGNLSKLEKLELSRAAIFSFLPRSTNMLTNLRTLCLRYARKLTHLPEEIGDLVNLTVLDLGYCSSISSLPLSIGNLINLVVIDLRRTKVTSLPDSMAKLTKLKYLCIDDSSLPQRRENKFLLMLAHRHPSLGSLGDYTELGREEVQYALACNRARSRTSSLFSKMASGEEEKIGLWPLVLQNSPHASRGYNHASTHFRLAKPDAIYQLLKNERDYFVGVLMHRKVGMDV